MAPGTIASSGSSCDRASSGPFGRSPTAAAGTGRAPAAAASTTTSRDLAALIEHLDAAPAHLAGSSLGATICLRLVASRPDLVASVSAHEPPLFALLAGDPVWEPCARGFQRRLGGVLELIEQDRTPEAAERFVEDLALGPGAWGLLPPEERQLLIRHAATFAEENADPTLYEIELASLTDVTTPALLTGGAESPPLFEPVLERLAAALPGLSATASRQQATSRTKPIPTNT